MCKLFSYIYNRCQKLEKQINFIPNFAAMVVRNCYKIPDVIFTSNKRNNTAGFQPFIINALFPTLKA